jgi:hypothetical protein
MLNKWMGIFAVAGLLSGCAQFGPGATEREAVRIEGTPGAAVIYLVRTNPDVSYLTAPIVVNDRMAGATHAGTYMRLEVPAGRATISGYAGDNGAISLDVQAGRVYFVQHTVAGSWRVTNPHSFFRVIDEARARGALVGASRVG